MSISKPDLLLSLLYAKGVANKNAEPIVGITRLTKLLFLVEKNAKLEDCFSFEPYKMGPYSSEIYSEIDFLQNFPSPDKALLKVKKYNTSDRLISPEQIKYFYDAAIDEEVFVSDISDNNNNDIYQLSEIGIKVAQRVWDNLTGDKKTQIENIKKNFGSMPLRKLLRYVYDKYPDMTVNSIIKESVYGG
jgi:uncharacterized protein YwgA